MKIIQLIAFLILVLFLSACTGNESTPQITNNNANQPATTQTQQQTNEQTAKTTETINEETTQKTLKDILLAKILKYTVEYDMTSANVDLKTTMYMSYPKFAMLTQGESGTAKSIFDGNTAYSCVFQKEWMCFKINTVTKSDNDKIEQDVKDGKNNAAYIGKCNVAGETGNKYSISSDGTTSEICYTIDGILLEMTTKGTTMKATKVLRSVESSAFTLPAEPKDISAMIPQN